MSRYKYVLGTAENTWLMVLISSSVLVMVVGTDDQDAVTRDHSSDVNTSVLAGCLDDSSMGAVMSQASWEE